MSMTICKDQSRGKIAQNPRLHSFKLQKEEIGVWKSEGHGIPNEVCKGSQGNEMKCFNFQTRYRDLAFNKATL